MVDAHWFIVQVFRGYEEKILQRSQIKEDFKVFYPKRKKVKAIKGENTIEVQALFPGYLFVETKRDAQSFFHFYKDVLSPLEGCVKILKHKENIEVLWPEEKIWIQSLLNEENVLENSKGLKVDDKVIITDGPLVGLESRILKIDRHKRIAILNFNLLGNLQEIEVGLEVISKQMI